MNSINLEELLSNASIDVIQKIFDYMSEELAEINKEDKQRLEKVNTAMQEKFEIIKQEFRDLESAKKNKLAKVLSEYIFDRDQIGAYYNQEYFKKRIESRNKANDWDNQIIVNK